MFPSQDDLDYDIEVKMKKDVAVDALQYYVKEEFE